MNATELFQEIVKDGQLSLHRGTPLLKSIPWTLPPSLATGGVLTLHPATRAKLRTAAALTLDGTLLIGEAETSARVVFKLASGQIDAMVVMARLPGDWAPSALFPDLVTYLEPAMFLETLAPADPVLVVTSRSVTLTERKFSLSRQELRAGTTIFARGLSDPLDVKALGYDAFTPFLTEAPGDPDSVAIHFDRTNAGLCALLTVWWPRRFSSKASIGSARILRAGWQMSALSLETETPVVSADWLWEVETQDGSDPVELRAGLPGAKGQTPSFGATFETPLPLLSQDSALSAFTGGIDPVPMLPFADNVEVSLRAIEVAPGTFIAVDLELNDARTAGPYRWKAIPQVLEISNVAVTVSAVMQPSTIFTFRVSGTARILGLSFDVGGELSPNDTPHPRSVSGKLIEAHSVDLDAACTALFGRVVDLPAPHLTLETATYTQDFTTNHRSIGLSLSGDVDLFDNGMLYLTGIGAEQVSDAGKTTSATLYGSLTLANVPIHMRATYDATFGWSYEGQALDGHELDLGDLVSELLVRIGAAEPALIPDVTLTNLQAKYIQNGKQLSLAAAASWTPPDNIGLPWHPGTIDTLVSLETQIDPTTGSRSTEVGLSWMHSSDFLATAEFSTAGNAFYLDWSASEDHPTIGLSTLHDSLKLGSVFALPRIAHWSIFEFSQLTIAYHAEPRQIELDTVSKLGEGKLGLSLAFARDSRWIKGTWMPDDEENGSIGLPDLLKATHLDNTLSLSGGRLPGVEVADASADDDTSPHLRLDLFTFCSLNFEYRHGKTDSLSFSGATKDADAENLFLSIYRTTGGTGFVAGYAFGAHQHLTDLPGLKNIPGLDKVEEFLSIEPQYLMVSTIIIPDFVPPIDGVADHDTSGTVNLANSDTGYHLIPGASFAGRVILQDSSNPAFSFISDLIGINELDAQITLGKGVAVVASIPGHLDFPIVGDTSLLFTHPHFGFATTGGGTPSMSVGGSIHMVIFGRAYDLDVSLVVIETGANALLHLEGFDLPAFHALPGVNFDDKFDLEIGLQFEPAGLNMGFEGSFWIGDKSDGSFGDVTIVMEVVEGVPTPEYVRFSISKLTFWSMFEAMTGSLKRLKNIDDGMQAVKGRHGKGSSAVEGLMQTYKNLSAIFDEVKMTDVAFHWCDSEVTLPDGTSATPGVAFKGRLSLFGFDLYGAFDFATGTSSHFTAHLEMEPVDIQGVLSITGDGKGMRKAEVETESERRARKGRALTKAENTYVLKPGGPVFIISTQHPPFLHADIHVRLFEVIHLDLTANIDMHHMEFDLSSGIGGLITFDLTCRLSYDGPPSFYAHGKLGVHLKADFSVGESPLSLDVDLDTGFDAEVTLEMNDQGHFKLDVDGSFEFQDLSLDIPTLTIKKSFLSLNDLPGKIVEQIENHGLEIFAELLNDPEQYIKAGVALAKGGVNLAAKRIEFMNDTALKAGELGLSAADEGLEATEEVVHAATQTLEKGLDVAKKEADRDIKALRKTTHDAVNKLNEESNAALRSAEDTFDDMTGGALDAVPGLKHFASNTIAKGVKLGGEAIDKVEKLAGQGLVAAIKAGKVLLRLADDFARGVEDTARTILKGAGIALEWTSHAFSTAAEGVKDVGTKVIGVVGNLSGKVVGGIKDGAKAIGGGFKDGANVIKGIFR